MPLPGSLRSFFGAGRSAESSDPARPRPVFPNRNACGEAATSARVSRGLEGFFHHIRGQAGLTILDLGGATQQNVSFITNLGHRLYSEDFLHILGETFGTDDPAGQSNPGQIEHFLRQTLDYPEQQFDGVLLWDVLEYLGPVLLAAVVERLRKIVRPGSYMLAFFHSNDKLEVVPCYSFRIQDMNALMVAQLSSHRPSQLFNNRSLEKLFGQFESVKFFLTKEGLREVVVKV
jgi:hypothetical protein